MGALQIPNMIWWYMILLLLILLLLLLPLVSVVVIFFLKIACFSRNLIKWVLAVTEWPTQHTFACIILHYYHPFNGLFSGTAWLSWYQKGRTSLNLSDTRDDGVLGWQRHQLGHNLCKRSAPHSRQITTPTPRHSIFYRRDAVPDAQPAVSKHWNT